MNDNNTVPTSNSEDPKHKADPSTTKEEKNNTVLTFNSDDPKYQAGPGTAEEKKREVEYTLWHKDLKTYLDAADTTTFSGAITFQGKRYPIVNRGSSYDPKSGFNGTSIMKGKPFLGSTLITLSEHVPDAFDYMETHKITYVSNCNASPTDSKSGLYFIPIADYDEKSPGLYRKSAYEKESGRFFTDKEIVAHKKRGEPKKITHYFTGNQVQISAAVCLFTLCRELGVTLELNLHQKGTVAKKQQPANLLNLQTEDSELYEKLQQLVENNIYQIVLTGAPGTGKTYISKQMVYWSLRDNSLYEKYNHWSSLTEKERPVFYLELKDYITELLIDNSFYTDKDLKTPLSDNMDLLQGVYEKTPAEAAELFRADCLALRGVMALVQFHPSYDYTDFVDGIRPIDQPNGVSFKRMDGSFMAFCRYVAWRNEVYSQGKDLPKYFFLIDEINRADLSKVLGELMFCLEGDKRGSTSAVHTQYHNLPTYFLDKNHNELKRNEENEGFQDIYSKGFYIPENVVVIGTMNDIDRSIESMDFALRRRFSWVDVAVDKEFLEDAFESGGFFSETLVAAVDEGVDPKIMEENLRIREKLLGEIRTAVAQRVSDFNKVMTQVGFGGEYYIAQGHFTNIALNEGNAYPLTTSSNHIVNAIMEWVWEYRISTLIKEYLRGDSDSNKESLLSGAWTIDPTPRQEQETDQTAKEKTDQTKESELDVEATVQGDEG